MRDDIIASVSEMKEEKRRISAVTLSSIEVSVEKGKKEEGKTAE